VARMQLSGVLADPPLRGIRADPAGGD